MLVADEPTQPIFGDEPSEDIAPRLTPGHTARHCARAKVFFAQPRTKHTPSYVIDPDRTGRGHSVATLDSGAMPCCRRVDSQFHYIRTY
jgi:hypothetical protein